MGFGQDGPKAFVLLLSSVSPFFQTACPVELSPTWKVYFRGAVDRLLRMRNRTLHSIIRTDDVVNPVNDSSVVLAAGHGHCDVNGTGCAGDNA